jgi:mRNA-degrading endonuclease RelE of RelBE toxin-antitoxin system
MSFKVQTIPIFDRQVKRLNKKYPSLKTDLQTLAKSLSQNPTQGISIGNNCYKIRFSIRSKSKGKSGGARIITYVFFKMDTVYLINIYDKSLKDSINQKDLKAILSQIDLTGK